MITLYFCYFAGTSRDNQIMTTTTPLSVNNASSTMQSQLATTTTSTLESTERTREVVSTMQSLTRQTLSNNIITPGSTSGSPAHSIMTQHHIIIRSEFMDVTNEMSCFVIRANNNYDQYLCYIYQLDDNQLFNSQILWFHPPLSTS